MAGFVGVGFLAAIIFAVYFSFDTITAFLGFGQSETPQVQKQEVVKAEEEDEEEEPEPDAVNYPHVDINGNIWTTVNMNTPVEGSFCYDDKESNCEKYGRLYTWYAAQEACGPGWHLPSPQEFEDLEKFAAGFDGTITASSSNENFKTITVGNQIWMAENLDVATKNSFCFQDNPNNCKRFGRLYTWKAAQNACPDGWELPSKSDWEKLQATLKQDGIDNSADLAAALRVTSWGNGKNTLSFNAEPSGTRFKGEYYGASGMATESAHYWTSSENSGDDNFAYDWFVRKDKAGLYSKNSKEDRAYSVRCIKSGAGLQANASSQPAANKGNRKSGDNLKSTYDWKYDGNGNNSMSFNALPAGNRDSDGEFAELGEYAYFWSSISSNNTDAYRWFLYSKSNKFVRGTDDKKLALSVRCVKD